MKSILRLTTILIFVLLLIHESIQSNETNSSVSTRNVTTTIIRKESSRTHLREVFDFAGTRVPFVFASRSSTSSSTTTPASVIISKQRSSTFRPTSSVLYLTPPKPRHIASIHSELESIVIDRTSALTLSWNVIVFLKPNSTTTQNKRNIRQINGNVETISESSGKVVGNVTTISTTTASTTTSTTTSTTISTPIAAIARVEEERNPLKWNIYIRRYGQSTREKFPITDRENSLDPPYTGNKSYHHRLDNLVTDSSYELCIQSINGGRMRETDEIKEKYPINAQTEFVGRNNPLFVCKEVLIKPPEGDEVDPSEIEFINRKQFDAENKIRGRLAEGSSTNDGTTRIEVSEDATDAFVVYTAISSGSTTVLILIVVALFCCCKCNQRKNMHKEYRQYNRAPSADSPYYY